jgi:3-hydroxyisobutyrate dehydrogenase-like beta-hydroxyacid dehydrogenase
MTKQKIGVINPGKMGICVASTIQNSGHDVYWVAEGRSPLSRQRAEEFNLSDAGSLAALCETCAVIVSVCPPHAAEEVAEQVLACAFQGVYLDVNAIAPQRAIRMGQAMARAGIGFVDGGIIGAPAWKRGKTWLYLSGEFHDAAEMIYRRIADFKDASAANYTILEFDPLSDYILPDRMMERINQKPRTVARE